MLNWMHSEKLDRKTIIFEVSTPTINLLYTTED